MWKLIPLLLRFGCQFGRLRNLVAIDEMVRSDVEAALGSLFQDTLVVVAGDEATLAAVQLGLEPLLDGRVVAADGPGRLSEAAELADDVLGGVHAADLWKFMTVWWFKSASLSSGIRWGWNVLLSGGLTPGCGLWWYGATMNMSRTRTIHYIGGPLNGETHPESPEETRFVTCAGMVYSACPTDQDTFTPGGMSIADAKTRMKLEQEFSGV